MKVERKGRKYRKKKLCRKRFSQFVEEICGGVLEDFGKIIEETPRNSAKKLRAY
jgi:hypothetical protein